ncbi:MFS transporter [Deltaproteobacteria bacterium]|nr:MFS transporter [Deltaproteobacteria bacterium]
MAVMNNKRHIIVFALITALCLIGDSMLYIVLPVHYRDMGLSSLWEVGIVLSVNRIVRLPLNPCIGWFYSRVSERAGLYIAAALAVTTTFSYGFLPNLAFWVLARCVWGAAWSLLRLGSLFCILKISTPIDRGHHTGLYNGLYRLGNLVGMFLGGLLADMIGVRSTVTLFSMVTALSVFLVTFYIPKGMAQQDGRAESGMSLRDSLAITLRDKKIFLLMLTGCCMALIIQGVVASTLSELISVHTKGGIPLWGAVIGASTLAGFFQALRWGWEPLLAPFVGRVSDRRIGRSRMLRHTVGLGALFFALLAAPLPLPLWFPCLLVMQLVSTTLTTVSDAAASDAAAADGGRALLMSYALLVDVGAALGPLFAYAMNEFFGINAVYCCCAALFALLFLQWRPQGTAFGRKEM